MSQRGTALVFALAVTTLLLLLATSLAVLVRASTMMEVGHSDVVQSFYYAEAGANKGNAEFKNIFQGFNVPTASDFNAKNTSFAGTAVRYQMTAVPGYPQFVRIPAGKRYAGLNSIDYLYSNFSSTLALDGSTKTQVGSRSLIHNIPLWQFIAFYNNDLEILPGQTMTLHGRVHSNSDLYLNSNSAATPLSVLDQPPIFTTVEVTAAKSMYRKRKDDGSCTGTVTIDTLATDPVTLDLTPRNLLCNGGAALTSIDVAPWLGALASGVTALSAPLPSASARGATGNLDYWPKADLRIVLDLTQPRMQLGQVLGLPTPGPSLYVIEVQRVDGTRDVGATNRLWNFMYNNPGKIFYNDRPNVALSTCYSACATDPTKYTPPFQDTGPSPSNAAMVYRRADDGNLSVKWNAAHAANSHNELDYRRGGFFNNREKRGGQGTFLTLLNIDVQALMQWNLNQPPGSQLFSPSDRSEGGIVIFASVIGPGTNPVPNPPQVTNYGVRIFDSPALPFPAGFTNAPDPTGLTVISDQAIYVEGNYNVNFTGVNPTWNPAGFIADSLNILSQNWEAGANDGKSLLPLASRIPIPTEINASFLAGVDSTAVGNYNGGLENYPRFHEDWSGGVTLTYRGSFVSLGTPKFVNGPWCGTGPAACDITTGNCTGGTSGANNGNCNIYNAPNRNWDYDVRFEDAANLPPLNPQAVYAEQQLFDEQFN